MSLEIKQIEKVEQQPSLSVKFQKDLEKFFAWAKENNVEVVDSPGWSVGLLKTFAEPARNKVEAFVKEVMMVHTVEQDGMTVSVKQLMGEYKSAKPGKKSKPAMAMEITIDEDLDTSECWFLESLKYSTEQLANKLGKALNTGGEGDKHRYEWKFKIGENVYSIYDWSDSPGWHLGGVKEIKRETEFFKEWIEYVEPIKTEVEELPEDSLEELEKWEAGLTKERIEQLFGDIAVSNAVSIV
jgi:hypothetical protein